MTWEPDQPIGVGLTEIEKLKPRDLMRKPAEVQYSLKALTAWLPLSIIGSIIVVIGFADEFHPSVLLFGVVIVGIPAIAAVLFRIFYFGIQNHRRWARITMALFSLVGVLSLYQSVLMLSSSPIQGSLALSSNLAFVISTILLLRSRRRSGCFPAPARNGPSFRATISPPPSCRLAIAFMQTCTRSMRSTQISTATLVIAHLSSANPNALA